SGLARRVTNRVFHFGQSEQHRYIPTLVHQQKITYSRKMSQPIEEFVEDVPELLAGSSYEHFSPLPTILQTAPDTECVMGIDEAGRGPVLGISPSPLSRSPR